MLIGNTRSWIHPRVCHRRACQCSLDRMATGFGLRRLRFANQDGVVGESHCRNWCGVQKNNRASSKLWRPKRCRGNPANQEEMPTHSHINDQRTRNNTSKAQGGKSTRTNKKNEQERVLTLLLSDYANVVIHLLQNVLTRQLLLHMSSANLLVNKGRTTSKFHETYHVLSVLNVGKALI